MKVKTVTLEKLPLHVRRCFSDHEWDVIRNQELKFGLVPHAREILMELRGFVLGELIGDETVTYPADWWQAFKVRWFPGWALQRWPAKMAVKKFIVHGIYPDFRPSLSETDQRCGVMVRVARLETGEEDFKWDEVTKEIERSIRKK